MIGRQPSKWSEVAIPFVVVVLFVWTVVALASVYTRDYTALTIVTPVMLLVTGAVVGVAVNNPKPGSKDKSDS